MTQISGNYRRIDLLPPGMVFAPKSLEDVLVRPLHQARKEHKLKFLYLDIFWWGGSLPREGVGAKKFAMSLEVGKTYFLAGYPGILVGISRGARQV